MFSGNGALKFNKIDFHTALNGSTTLEFKCLFLSSPCLANTNLLFRSYSLKEIFNAFAKYILPPQLLVTVDILEQTKSPFES